MSCAFSIFKDKGSFWGCTCEISSFLCFFQQLWRIMSLRISQAGSGSQAKTKRTEEKAPSVSSPSPLASVVDSDGENSDSEVKKKKKKKKLRVHADSRASTPPTTRTPIETYTQASSKALSLPHFPSSASTRSSPVEDYFDEFANGGLVVARLFGLSLASFLVGYVGGGGFLFFLVFVSIASWILCSVSQDDLRQTLHSNSSSYTSLNLSNTSKVREYFFVSSSVKRTIVQTPPFAERVQFLNRLGSMMMDKFAGNLDRWLHEKLNNLLVVSCPASLKYLKFKQFSLGKNLPPKMDQVLLSTRPKDNFMELDFNLCWESGIRGTLAGRMKSGGVGFTVLVKDLVIVGRMRVTGYLSPTSDLYFGPMTVSFLDAPEFDIDLKTIAGVDVMDLPGIRTFVRDMLSGGIIEEYMIWPKVIDFDLSSEIEIAGLDGIEDALEYVKDLKRPPQILRKYIEGLRDNDWHSLYKLGLKTKKFKAGEVIAIDVGRGISHPVLCRVASGEVNMEVWRNSSKCPLKPCLNHSTEENKCLRTVAPAHVPEMEPVVIRKFIQGEFFAESTFVNGNDFSVVGYSDPFMEEEHPYEEGAGLGGEVEEEQESSPAPFNYSPSPSSSPSPSPSPPPSPSPSSSPSPSLSLPISSPLLTSQLGSCPSNPTLTNIVVFVASTDVEIAIGFEAVVEEANSDASFQERFYRTVAIGLVSSVKKATALRDKVPNHFYSMPSPSPLRSPLLSPHLPSPLWGFKESTNGTERDKKQGDEENENKDSEADEILGSSPPLPPPLSSSPLGTTQMSISFPPPSSPQQPSRFSGPQSSPVFGNEGNDNKMARWELLMSSDQPRTSLGSSPMRSKQDPREISMPREVRAKDEPPPVLLQGPGGTCSGPLNQPQGPERREIILKTFPSDEILSTRSTSPAAPIRSLKRSVRLGGEKRRHSTHAPLQFEDDEGDKKRLSGKVRSPVEAIRNLKVSKVEQQSDTFKVYFKDSSGKYVHRRVPISNVTLEQCKYTLFREGVLSHLNLDTEGNKGERDVEGEGEARTPRFFTVPDKTSKLQLQVGNLSVKTGMIVMIEGSTQTGTKGHIVYHSKKFILDERNPGDLDKSAHFVVRTKGLIRLRDGSSATLITLKNLKSNGYISRAVGVSKTRKIVSSERMLGLEILDVSTPAWSIFGKLMADPQNLFLGKDGSTIYMGKGQELIQFQLVPLEQEGGLGGGEEEDSFDPTLALDESFLIPDVLQDNECVSFVLSSEPPSDFSKKLKLRKGLEEEKVKILGTMKEALKRKREESNDEFVDNEKHEKHTHVRRLLNIRQGERLMFDTRCRVFYNDGWISGRLYVFEHYFGFHGSFFTNKISLAFRLRQITETKITKKTLFLKTDILDLQVRTRSTDTLETILNFVDDGSRDTQFNDPLETTTSLPLASPLESNVEKNVGLTSDDWKELLKGAKVQCYEKGAVILGEGQMSNGLYQVSHGSACVEEFDFDLKRTKVIAHLPVGEIFGEMSFLCNSKEGAMASASVIADEDEVDVYFIPADFILKCFQTKRLGGRFYHYIAACLSKRFFSSVKLL